ncbi:MAG: homogentisate 1,2-dioxygenase, partial [Cellvibrionaceae bacterium]|nr:homogentisate 1,2-dioxygenase [Cellvibrionaceae bacterium]
GGCSLHNCMSPHGPEAAVFEKASNAELAPQRYENTMAFMFESRYAFALSKFALEGPSRQRNYPNCWQGLKKIYNGQADAGQ